MVFRSSSSELPCLSDQRITLLWWLPRKCLSGLPLLLFAIAIFTPMSNNSICIGWKLTIKLKLFQYVKMNIIHFCAIGRKSHSTWFVFCYFEISLKTVKILKWPPCIFFVSVRSKETLEKIFNLTLKMNIFRITE